MCHGGMNAPDWQAIREHTETLDTPDGAVLLMNLGTVQLELCDQDDGQPAVAKESFELAHAIRCALCVVVLLACSK